MKPIVLTLPEPPSVNRIWRTGKGRTYKVKEAVNYGVLVLAAWRTAYPKVKAPPFPEGPVKYTMTWYRGRRAGDLSNRTKVVEDALNGVVWTDDGQVDEIHLLRKDAKGKGRVELTIEANG